MAFSNLQLSMGHPLSSTTAVHTWTSPGTYNVKGQARCDGGEYSARSDSLTVVISETPHIVNKPQTPNGPSSGVAETPYQYTTSATCNQGHAIEYRYFWGDDTWTWYESNAAQSHAWAESGTYDVTVIARCATDNSIVSELSDTKTVVIGSSSPDIELTLYRVSGTDGTPDSSTPGTEKSSFCPGETVRVTLRADNTGADADVLTVLNVREPDDSTMLYDSHDSATTDSGSVEDNSTGSPLTSTEGYNYYSFDKTIPADAPEGKYDIGASIRDLANWETVYDTTAPGRNVVNWDAAWVAGVLVVQGPQYEKWATIEMPDGGDYGLYAHAKEGRSLTTFLVGAPEDSVESYYLTRDPEDPEDVMDKGEFLSRGMPRVLQALFNRMPYQGWSCFGEKEETASGTYYVPYTWGWSLWKITWANSEQTRKDTYVKAIESILQMEGLPADMDYVFLESGDEQYRVRAIEPGIAKVINDALDKAVEVTGQPITWDRSKATLVDQFKLIYKAIDLEADIIKEVIGDDYPPTLANDIQARFVKVAGWANKLPDAAEFSQRVTADMLMRLYLSESTLAQERLEILKDAYDHAIAGDIPGLDPMLLTAIEEVEGQVNSDVSAIEALFGSVISNAISWDTLGYVIGEMNSSGALFGIYNRVAWEIAGFLKCHSGKLMVSQASLQTATAVVGSALTIAGEWAEKADVRYRLSAFMAIYNMVYYQNKVLSNDPTPFTVGLRAYQDLSQIRIMQNYALWFMASEMAAYWDVAPEDWVKNAVSIGLAAKSAPLTSGYSLTGPVYAALNDIGGLTGSWIWSADLEEIEDVVEDVVTDVRYFTERHEFLMLYLDEAYLDQYEGAAPPVYDVPDLAVVSIPDFDITIGETKTIVVTAGNLLAEETYSVEVLGLEGFASVTNTEVTVKPTGSSALGPVQA